MDDLHLPLAALEAQARFLKRSHRVISLEQLAADLDQGRDPSPLAVLITFDDGYLNHLTLAAPLLQSLGLPFAVFVGGNDAIANGIIVPDRGLLLPGRDMAERWYMATSPYLDSVSGNEGLIAEMIAAAHDRSAPGNGPRLDTLLFFQRGYALMVWAKKTDAPVR